MQEKLLSVTSIKNIGDYTLLKIRTNQNIYFKKFYFYKADFGNYGIGYNYKDNIEIFCRLNNIDLSEYDISNYKGDILPSDIKQSVNEYLWNYETFYDIETDTITKNNYFNKY